jgi:hypothetical protein
LVLALTAAKLGTTHKMRLVCWPSDSSLEVQLSSEAPLGFLLLPPLPDCDSACEGGAEVLSACWHAPSPVEVSDGFGADACPQRGSRQEHKEGDCRHAAAEGQRTLLAEPSMPGGQAHSSEYSCRVTHNPCFSELRKHLPTNPAASRKSAAKSTPATCRKRCISRVGTNGFRTINDNAV